MLIYHFGSKSRLDEELSILLDEKLRLEFQEFANKYQDESQKFILSFWNHVTSNKKFIKLAALSLTLSNEMLKKTSFQEAMNKQANAWIKILIYHVRSKSRAEMIFLLGQGAFLDFLITGNKLRGQRVLLNFLKNRRSLRW